MQLVGGWTGFFTAAVFGVRDYDEIAARATRLKAVSGVEARRQ